MIEELVKPLTLALRLFGNIFSGALMLTLLSHLAPYVLWAPDIVWKLFDAGFVAPIQAFIFSLLTILYYQAAMAEEGAH
jgi:F-type H+-transporting ATPase subunit a